MRPIRWFHISDFHMRTRDSWSQDVVLKAMCGDIAQQRKEGVLADFILATGDVAFSGNAAEYKLAAAFFDAVSVASGVPKECIFCIPGNHDIDRDRQKLAFQGARYALQSQNQVDLLLTPEEDLQSLLERQKNYRNFQKSYFGPQERMPTSDGLGYVSVITIDDVRLAIVGLDSAWLADGGPSDHGKLLIGERQVINALDLANTLNPHILIATAHHPFHLLQEYDRLPIQNRIERACQFYHCGHLHEPEARHVGSHGIGCLTLAAGASYETRQSHNTYSLVTLDLLGAQRTVAVVQYHPSKGAFSFKSSERYPIEVTPSGACGVGELAAAMESYRPALGPLVHYLSALLLDAKAEIPIPSPQGYAFGSITILQSQPDGDYKRKATDFMAFKNALRVFYNRMSLAEIFARYGGFVEQYGLALEAICAGQPGLKTRLAEYETDSRAFVAAEPRRPFFHTITLLTDLAAGNEWELLNEQAERHLDSPDPSLALQAKRMLALALAHSEESEARSKAIELYQSLREDRAAEATDIGNLISLLLAAGREADAKLVTIDAIEVFPASATDYLFQVGLKVVEATGDGEFRKRLTSAAELRGKRA